MKKICITIFVALFCISCASYVRADSETEHKYEKILKAIHARGCPETQDIHAAYNWLQKAAQSGNTAVYFDLATLCTLAKGLPVSISNETQIFNWYYIAATNGHPDAQLQVGIAYNSGFGVEEDAKKAVYWLYRGAQNGSVLGTYELAQMYENGRGVEADPKEAFRWYYLAATQGYVDAQAKVARKYYQGVGVEEDKEESLKWYTLAAEQNNPYAQNVLGLFYEKGEIVTQDYKKAEWYYLNAASQGNVYAEANLGDIYYFGDESIADKTKALQWYERAGVHGHGKASFCIARMYERGDGVKKDYERAFTFYQKALSNGATRAHFSLADFYYMGKFVEKDLDKALHHFLAASEDVSLDRSDKILSWLCAWGIYMQKGDSKNAYDSLKKLMNFIPPVMRVLIAIIGSIVISVLLCIVFVIWTFIKKDIHAWRIRDAVIIFFLTMAGQLIANVLVAVPLMVEFSGFMRLLMWVTITNSTVVLIAMLHVKRIGWNIKSAFAFTRVSLGKTIISVIACLAIVYIFNIIYQIVLRLWDITIEPQLLVETIGDIKGVVPVILLFVCVGVIAPICEELIFRSVIYRGLRARMNVTAAVLISSFVFASVHLQVQYIPPLMVFGIVLALIRERTGSIIPACIVHIINNTLMVAIITMVIK